MAVVPSLAQAQELQFQTEPQGKGTGRRSALSYKAKNNEIIVIETPKWTNHPPEPMQVC